MSNNIDKGKGPAPTDSDTVAPNLLPLPNTIFRVNRERTCELMRRTGGDGVLYAHAPPQQCIHDSDREVLYRPESNFYYLTGCEIPEARVIIDVATGRTTLLVPRLPESYAIWVGPIPKLEEYVEKHGVDAVRYTDEAADVLQEMGCGTLHILDGVNTDSGANVAAPPEADEIAAKAGAKIDRSAAYPAVAEARVFKSEAELNVLRWVNKVTSAAHIAVMQSVKPGMAEFQMESRFLHEVYAKGGARFTAYTCICAAGPSGASLHYPDNDKVIADGAICLLDMGAEYHQYASDITSSYPANGKFSDNQRAVYNAVLDANLAVQAALRPGVSWTAMHELSYMVMAEHLIKLGVFKGASAREIVDKDIMGVFQPHGLGHFMGHDVHDVGGYGCYDGGKCSASGEPIPERSSRPGFKSLRTSRVLQAGMVVTVEPGLYRIPALLEKALADPSIAAHIDTAKLDEIMPPGFGGVRIEDDIIITEDGSENMSNVPRTVEEIEAVMAGGEWKVW